MRCKEKGNAHQRPGANRVEAALLASVNASVRSVGARKQSWERESSALGVSPKSSSNYNDNTKPIMGQGECSGKDR